MFQSLFHDMFEPDYRTNMLPRLPLDDYDYIPSRHHFHSQPRSTLPRHLRDDPDNYPLIRIHPLMHTLKSSGGPHHSQYLQDDANQFKVRLNVKHFSPDEIDVKTVDNFIVVHGKHQEQADEHGFVSREFTRRYLIPDDVESVKVKSSLSRDGILTISAPRKVLEPPPKNERIVPITIQKPAAVEELHKQQLQEQNETMQQ